jgi:non-homologous end joining protein Ku
VARRIGKPVRNAPRRRALVVLELEWADNMRDPGPRVTAPVAAEFTEGEFAAALRLVDAYADGPSALDAIRDERQALRAELLAAAREGGAEAAESVDSPPEPNRAEEVEDVVARWTAAAEARQ